MGVPCGLKKPVIQKQLGRPPQIHVENWLLRSRNSVNQKPRVGVAHDTFVQIVGTRASNMLSSALRRFCKNIAAVLYCPNILTRFLHSYFHLIHDDGAFDGEFEVVQGVAEDGDDALHAVDLLTQEDVERLQDSHLFQAVRHLQTDTN